MKKCFVILCAICVMTVHAFGHNVSRLVRQARNGNAEACKTLAICYRDGAGVDRSWVNMACMYENYCLRTGGRFAGLVVLLDDDSLFRLLTDIFISPDYDEDADVVLNKLRMLAPVEATVVETALSIRTEGVSSMALATLCEAESRGSELAVVCLWIYYQKVEDKSAQEECCIRLAKKYPAFNLTLGDLYLQRFNDDGNPQNLETAMDYFHKADKAAMLTPRYESLYNHYRNI